MYFVSLMCGYCVLTLALKSVSEVGGVLRKKKMKRPPSKKFWDMKLTNRELLTHRNSSNEEDPRNDCAQQVKRLNLKSHQSADELRPFAATIMNNSGVT